MMLFTRQNLEKAQLIEYNNATSILESNYNASLDTKLIIHGFGSSCHRVWAREMRLSFLAVVSSSKNNFVYYLNKAGLDRTYKPHYHYQNLSPLANGTYLNREKYAILQTHRH